MDINRSTLEQFYFGVSAAFQGGLGTAESQYEKIAMVVPSGTRENVYPWLGTLPSMQKWAGDRIIRNLKAHKYSIENEKFEMTIDRRVWAAHRGQPRKAVPNAGVSHCP